MFFLLYVERRDIVICMDLPYLGGEVQRGSQCLGMVKKENFISELWNGHLGRTVICETWKNTSWRTLEKNNALHSAGGLSHSSGKKRRITCEVFSDGDRNRYKRIHLSVIEVHSWSSRSPSVEVGEVQREVCGAVDLNQSNGDIIKDVEPNQITCLLLIMDFSKNYTPFCLRTRLLQSHEGSRRTSCSCGPEPACRTCTWGWKQSF